MRLAVVSSQLCSLTRQLSTNQLLCQDLLLVDHGHDAILRRGDVHVAFWLLVFFNTEAEGQGSSLDQAISGRHVSETTHPSLGKMLFIGVLARKMHIAAVERGRQ